MHPFNLLSSIAALLLLTACDSAKKPSESNFAKAINQYVAEHGAARTVIGRKFPIDVPRSEQSEQYGIGPKLAILEQAGLVHASDTTAVIHGMLDSLRGSTPPQPVAIRTDSGRQEVFSADPQHTRTGQRLLLRTEERRFHH
jgi:hypothetical protein